MVASRVMVGATLKELREEGLLTRPVTGGHVSVKEAVLPFNKFPEVDPVLGPEMRSTGEVMGIDRTFGTAYAKSQLAASNRLPSSGNVFISLSDPDKPAAAAMARSFVAAGLTIVATEGTAAYLMSKSIPVAAIVRKISETSTLESAGRHTALEFIERGEIQLVVNTPRGFGAASDGTLIRRACTVNKVPIHTTVAAASAAASGIGEWAHRPFTVKSLQEHLGLEG